MVTYIVLAACVPPLHAFDHSRAYQPRELTILDFHAQFSRHDWVSHLKGPPTISTPTCTTSYQTSIAYTAAKVHSLVHKDLISHII